MNSSEFFGLAFILLAAFALRLFAWSQTAVLFNDGPIFLAMANAIGEGRWAEIFAHPYHPLYPALISFVGKASFAPETAAVLVSTLGGVLSVLALYWFVREAFGRDEAWLAAWIVALHPSAVDFSADVMSDGVYTGFFLVAFAAMARAVERPTIGASVLCAVGAGLAYWVRPEGAGLLVAFIPLLVGRGLLDRSTLRRSLRACGVLIAVAAVVIAPFVIALSFESGEITLTQKKSLASLAGSAAHQAAEADKWELRRRQSDADFALPLPEISVRSDGEGARRPTRDVAGVLEAIGRVATTSMASFRFELIGLVALGLWVSWREGPQEAHLRRGVTIAVPIVLYSGLLVLLVWGAGYVSRRHALPALLPLVGYAALGWRWLWRKFVEWTRLNDVFVSGGVGSARVGCLILVVVLGIGWGGRDLRPRRVDRAPIRLAAEWLRVNYPESGRVAGQKRRVAYYAKARFVPLMPGLDGHLAEYLRDRRARWVVIDAAKLDDHQGLEDGIGSWLQLVHRISSLDSRDREVLVLSVEMKPAG